MKLLENRPQVARYLLASLMLVSLVLAVANWQQRRTVQIPSDGVLWSETALGLVARNIESGGPAARAGVRSGDILYATQNGGHTDQIKSLEELTRRLYAATPDTAVDYTVIREGAPLTIHLRLAARADSTPLQTVLWIAGLFYLMLGAWVLWRRMRAPRARLFVLYCLTSFVLFAFSYSGKFDSLDWLIYWTDAAAMLLQPALFAHFCLTYWQSAGANRPASSASAGNLRFGIYASATLLGLLHIGFALGVLTSASAPLSDSSWWMDRIETGYLAAMYMLGTGLLAAALRRATSRPSGSRQLWKQMAWVLGGALAGLAPFVVNYAVPYFLGIVAQPWMALSAMSLIALPAGMAYAMARHRLLDVDIAIGRGVAWTLATGLLVGCYMGAAALAGDLFRRTIPDVGTLGLIAAVIATGLLLRPLQSWIQRQLDESFLRHRYDYRQAVLYLGHQLGRHTDREEMVRSLLDPLTQLLELDRAAVFIPAANGGYQIFLECGMENDGLSADTRAQESASAGDGHTADFGYIGLLEESAGESGSRGLRRRRDWLHFPGWPEWDQADRDDSDPIHQEMWEHPQWHRSLRDMRMPYYFPCRAKDRLVAVLGLGRTTGGELLPEQDVALVETLCGYLALALESGSLLESLTEKARQYADLQQFGENILESINVGLLAVDLEDRVEAINTPLELMLPLPFRQAKGSPLHELLPADLLAEYDRSREDMGIHNINRYRVVGDNNGGSGQERVLNISIAPLLSRNCECIGRLMVFDDVTDRVALESQLAQADKLSSIGLLAAGVAHEVNTPLTVISTQAQMLQKALEKMLARPHQDRPTDAPAASPTGGNGSETAEKASKIVERIISQTFRASEIVNGLLKFSRSNLSRGNGPRDAATSGVAEDFAPVDMNQLISETLLLVDHPLRASQIQTETHLEPGLALISGHSGKLQQVLLNLILNARDAMAHGGRLRLTTWTEEGSVHVEVRDTGVGIAPEVLPRIYDPFFTTKWPGKIPGRDPANWTGLGLAVTYGIIQEHSAVIRVESKPGAGTRFELQFPALRKPVHA
ncbi:MAG: PDZ domain-containing protein [Acidobacteria bacterium]|nr:PDZ domain-containing protein [Acidobacteriota bacterium]